MSLPTAAPLPVVAPGTSKPPFRGGPFEALRIKNFRYYAASGVFQSGAMNMQQLANGWFAYHLTGSSAVLGLTLLAQAIPQTTLSFVGGVVSDRVPRRLIMMIVFAINAALAIWIGVSAQTGVIQWRDLVIRSFVFGCGLAFLMPSRQGIIGELVGRERIMSAISLNQAIQSCMQFVGPAIGGFVIAWVSIQGAYYAIAACSLLAAVCMLPVRYTPRTVVTKAGVGGFLDNMGDGIRYARGNRDVLLVLAITFCYVSFAQPYNTLLPVFAQDVLKVGPEKLGLLSSLSGVGALTGAMTISFWRPRLRGLLFMQAAFLMGCALIAFCISTSYTVSACIVLAVGLAQAMRMTLSNILIQTYTEDAYVGRMLSLQMMEIGLTSFAAFGVAVFADTVGVRYAVGTTSVLLVLTAVAFYVFAPRLRKLT